MKEKGYVLWRGESRIDGSPIVAIATMKTNNRKTGDMVQTWILRDDVSPIEAVNLGLDIAICGDCPHRWALRRSGKSEQAACYVNVGQAPLAIWRAYKRGAYCDQWSPDVFEGRAIRIGAYGDPVAVPIKVWRSMLIKAIGHTGYTHQWKYARAKSYKGLLMASVDSLEESLLALSNGWRFFRIGEKATANDIKCPSDRISCEQCKLCSGVGEDSKRAGVKSIFIPAH